MKKLLPFLLAAACLAPAVASAAAFEGKVAMKMTEPRGGTHQINYSLKPGFMRVEIEMKEGMTGAMIMDFAKKEMLMLMPAQHMAMVMAIPEAAANPQVNADPEATFEKTGEKETILGYPTEKYLAKSKGTTTELWLTDKLGSFMGTGGAGMMGSRGKRGRAGQSWEDVLKGKELFPLRAVGKAADGKETFRLEVTAVEKTSLPASLFTAPADYQKMDMSSMSRGSGMPRAPGN